MKSARTRVGFGLLLTLPLLVAPTVARAQDMREGPTFGTPSVSHTLQTFSFVGETAVDNDSAGMTGSGSRYCTAPCFFAAPVPLPAGAVMTRIELAGCDSIATANVTARLFRVPAPDGTPNVLATATTGPNANVPGCGFFNANLAAPHSIDNVAWTYFVEVGISGSTLSTRFQAVRVFYHLEVSPAPGVATFTDVPTGHPYFRFIEALVASGITAGCGGGNYCPGNPITRGEMAVFLSVALGLHFAP